MINMFLKDLPYIEHLDSGNFFLIAGPCVIENDQMCMDIAGQVKSITDKLKIPYIFKASYRKANRSRLESFTGIGDSEGLSVLARIRETYNIPVLTDIHAANEATYASGYVDVLQIPAFLCRQTDLLVAAAKTGKYINIKKGQFVSAYSMKFTADKVVQSGNNRIILTERGTMLGYQDLVVDFRSIPEMKALGFPVVLDVTHSLQQPNQPEGVSGGRPSMIETIARAGIAAGTDGIFLETHPHPGKALSDGANMLPLVKLEKILTDLTEIRRTILKLT